MVKQFHIMILQKRASALSSWYSYDYYPRMINFSCGFGSKDIQSAVLIRSTIEIWAILRATRCVVSQSPQAQTDSHLIGMRHIEVPADTTINSTLRSSG